MKTHTQLYQNKGDIQSARVVFRRREAAKHKERGRLAKLVQQSSANSAAPWQPVSLRTEVKSDACAVLQYGV